MANEINGDGTQVAVPAVAPAVPTTERLTVPVSALFSDTERTIEGEKPVETPAPAAAPVPAAAPSTETPAEPPAVPAAEKPADPLASAPVKVKVGGKEYTEAELEKALAERSKPAAAPAAPAAPVAAAPAEKVPTAEEVSKAETDWCTRFAGDAKLNFAPTPEEVETILSGGEDAAKLLASKFNDVCAKAVLLARKSIYADMNPTLQDIQGKLAPVVTNAQEVERAAAEQMFFSAYPDLKVDADTMQQARSVADALLARYPAEVRAMTPEQFMAEVHRQTDVILQQDYKRWNPTATGTWRDSKKPAIPAAVPAAAPATKPAAPAAKAPSIPAPGANSPAAIAAPGGGANWHKDTAKSLAD